MTQDTTTPTDAQDSTTDDREATAGSAPGRTLVGLLAGGLLGLGAVGTASADPQGQIGTESDPVEAVYTQEIDGGVTGGRAVTDLAGTGLTVDSGSLALSSTPALPDVNDADTSVDGASGITFGDGLTVTDDGDGAVRVDLDLDTRFRQGPKLTASDGDDGDSFGYAVALSDDGTTAIVGAPFDDDPNGFGAGSAYVFDGSGGWANVSTETSKLYSSKDAQDQGFGRAVALSGDGRTAIVGAPVDGDVNEGTAYVFDGSDGWGNVSTETTELPSIDRDARDRMGASVALSADGTIGLVLAFGEEAPNDATGVVYVFDGSDGWADVSSATTKLYPSDGTESLVFGEIALSADGTTALVGGNNTAYAFDGSGGWANVSTETTKLSASDLGSDDDAFGANVALSSDGTTALVGAHLDDDANGTDAGSAYVFDGSGGWANVSTETTKLSASDGEAGDWFGYAVALSGNGTIGLVGAPVYSIDYSGPGAAYEYHEALQ